MENPSPSPIILAKVPTCKMCGLDLQNMSAHLSSAHCVRDLVSRVNFLRHITALQAKQLDESGQAVVATHRFAYAILHHLTEGGNRVVLSHTDFSELPSGVAVTMTPNEDGDFEVVGVVPEKKKEEANVSE